MIGLLAILAALLGVVGSAWTDARASRVTSLGAAVAAFSFAAAGALRGTSHFEWFLWGGWKGAVTLGAGAGVVGAAVAGAYLAELLAAPHRSAMVLLLSEAGALLASYAGNLETAALGWVLCWAPLAANMVDDQPRVRYAVRNFLAALALLLLAVLGVRGPWAHWVVPAALVLSSAAFPSHAWLAPAMPGSGGTGLLHAVATRLVLLYWLRSRSGWSLGAGEVTALEVLAILGLAHGMLVAWTFRRRPRRLLAPGTVVVNSVLILAGLCRSEACWTGGLLLGAGAILAQVAAHWALESHRWDLPAAAGWALIGLPGSGLLPGLFLVVLGLGAGGGLPHPRACALVIVVTWGFYAAAVVRSWTEAVVLGELANRDEEGAGLGADRGTRRRDSRAAAALLALALVLLLGVWPRVWTGAAAETGRTGPVSAAGSGE